MTIVFTHFIENIVIVLLFLWSLATQEYESVRVYNLHVIYVFILSGVSNMWLSIPRAH